MTDNNKTPVSVNVKWTPGETGKNPTQDQPPSMMGEIKEFQKTGNNTGSQEKEEAREQEKLQILVNELQKTDPLLITKVTSLVDGNPGTFGTAYKGHDEKNGKLEMRELQQMAIDLRSGFSLKTPLEVLDSNGDKKVDVNELRAAMQKFLKEKGITPPVEASHASNLAPAQVTDVRADDKGRTV